jgi:hypothetical protein
MPLRSLLNWVRVILNATHALVWLPRDGGSIATLASENALSSRSTQARVPFHD